jgi:alpha,alpha-trehalase
VSPFRPVHRQNGYLPIADHALIGDGRGSALVARDGTISWMCVPRFDAPPLFCGLLDTRRGGAFRLVDDVIEADQRYLDDTAVVVTTLRTPTGVCQVTDGFLLHRGARLDDEPAPGVGALLRRVHVLSGTVQLAMGVDPLGGTEHTTAP